MRKFVLVGLLALGFWTCIADEVEARCRGGRLFNGRLAQRVRGCR